MGKQYERPFHGISYKSEELSDLMKFEGESALSTTNTHYGVKYNQNVHLPYPNLVFLRVALPKSTIPASEEKKFTKVAKEVSFTVGKALWYHTYGTVRQAHSKQYNLTLALKCVNKEYPELKDYIEWILPREIALLKILGGHPNVIRFICNNESDKYYFLATENVKGINLHDYIIEKNNLEESEAKIIFIDILNVVATCHSFGICIRGLTCDNVLLDRYHMPLITNFEHAIVPGYDNRDIFKGTPSSPPEVFLSHVYDSKPVDVWTLGIILYTMVSGEPPHKIGSAIHSDGIPISFPVTVSNECRSLIKRMLSFSPMKRCTISEIKRDIWLNDIAVISDDNQLTVKVLDSVTSSENVHNSQVIDVIECPTPSTASLNETIEPIIKVFDKPLPDDKPPTFKDAEVDATNPENFQVRDKSPTFKNAEVDATTPEDFHVGEKKTQYLLIVAPPSSYSHAPTDESISGKLPPNFNFPASIDIDNEGENVDVLLSFDDQYGKNKEVKRFSVMPDADGKCGSLIPQTKEELMQGNYLVQQMNEPEKSDKLPSYKVDLKGTKVNKKEKEKSKGKKKRSKSISDTLKSLLHNEKEKKQIHEDILDIFDEKSQELESIKPKRSKNYSSKEGKDKTSKKPKRETLKESDSLSKKERISASNISIDKKESLNHLPEKDDNLSDHNLLNEISKKKKKGSKKESPKTSKEKKNTSGKHNKSGSDASTSSKSKSKRKSTKKDQSNPNSSEEVLVTASESKLPISKSSSSHEKCPKDSTSQIVSTPATEKNCEIKPNDSTAGLPGQDGKKKKKKKNHSKHPIEKNPDISATKVLLDPELNSLSSRSKSKMRQHEETSQPVSAAISSLLLNEKTPGVSVSGLVSTPVSVKSLKRSSHTKKSQEKNSKISNSQLDCTIEKITNDIPPLADVSESIEHVNQTQPDKKSQKKKKEKKKKVV